MLLWMIQLFLPYVDLVPRLRKDVLKTRSSSISPSKPMLDRLTHVFGYDLIRKKNNSRSSGVLKAWYGGESAIEVITLVSASPSNFLLHQKGAFSPHS